MKTIITIFISLFVFSTLSSAQVKLNYRGIGKLDIAAFKINSTSVVDINGRCAALKSFSDDNGNKWWGEKLYTYGWILNSNTREVIWHQLENLRGKSKKPNGIYSFSDKVKLQPGEYEVYFTAMFDNTNKNASNFISNVISKIVNDYDEDDIEDNYINLSFESGDLEKLDDFSPVKKYSSGSIINFISTGDNQSFKRAFKLSDETKLKLYTIGEARDESSFDYAWIYDLTNHKKLWGLDYLKSEHAGGADKNVMIKNEITLPAGTYLVYYITDDSHSFDEWNSLPPDDPQFWGITIWPASEKDKQNITILSDYEEAKPVVNLTKVGDDEIVSQGFSVKEEMKLRVLGIGEAPGNNFVDYGWIINADTREKIWEMEKENSSNAGGASKNRMIDEVIKFNKGNYIAYFLTDGSHSYEDWNSAPPYDGKLWGISLYPLNNSDKNKVEKFNANNYKSKNFIAEIIHVRDDEYLDESFSLKSDSQIRIYAIGEGSSGQMFDYAWIKNNDNGKTFWEMSYRKTEHAGGADKNRLFNDVVEIPKGNYTLYYQTDGSHSYNDWNSSPPSDADRYGVTLMYER